MDYSALKWSKAWIEAGGGYINEEYQLVSTEQTIKGPKKIPREKKA